MSLEFDGFSGDLIDVPVTFVRITTPNENTQRIVPVYGGSKEIEGCFRDAVIAWTDEMANNVTQAIAGAKKPKEKVIRCAYCSNEVRRQYLDVTEDLKFCSNACYSTYFEEANLDCPLRGRWVCVIDEVPSEKQEKKTSRCTNCDYGGLGDSPMEVYLEVSEDVQFCGTSCHHNYFLRNSKKEFPPRGRWVRGLDRIPFEE